MCLISFAPEGTDKYSKKFIEGIKKGATNNTDGFGYAYWLPGEEQIHFDKKFQSVETLLEALEKLKLPNESKLVVHSRNGNKGAKDVFNAHPFIVSETLEDEYTIQGETDKPILVHNGTFFGYNDKDNIHSDTYLFVKKFLAIPEVLSILKRDINLFRDLFDNKISTNKLIIMFSNGQTKVIGNFIEDELYLFSNDTYKYTYVKDVGGHTSYNYGHSHHSRYMGPNRNLEDDRVDDRDDGLEIILRGKNKTENNPLGIRFNTYTRDEIYFECLEDQPKYHKGDLFVFHKGHGVAVGDNCFYLKKVTMDVIVKDDPIVSTQSSQYIFADEISKYFMVKSKPKYLHKYNSYIAFVDWIGNLSGNKIKKILRGYNDVKESDLCVSIKFENKVTYPRKDALQLFIFENFDNFKKTSGYISIVEKEKEKADKRLKEIALIADAVEYGEWAGFGI